LVVPTASPSPWPRLGVSSTSGNIIYSIHSLPVAVFLNTAAPCQTDAWHGLPPGCMLR
jgi:hypothetical protein